MSSFYTTKSLGREWLPSPIRSASSKGRYGTWPPPLSIGKTRLPSYENAIVNNNNHTINPSEYQSYPSGWKRFSRLKKWSKAHERLVLTLILIYLIWTFGASFTSRVSRGATNWIHWTNGHLKVVTEDIWMTHDLARQNLTWSDTAYVTYATDTQYLCSSIMLLSQLHALRVRPDLVLLHSELWTEESNLYSVEAELLRRARDDLGVKLVPVVVKT